MGRRLIPVFLLLCAIAVGLLPRAHTFAQETHTASWSRYDVTIELERSGALLITERFDVAFSGLPAFTYGFADILTDRIDQLEVVSVSEERPEGRQEFRQVSTGDFNRTPGTFVVEVDADSTYIEYAFSPALNEARVFELTYRAYGALRVYGHGEGRDEQIWWTAIDSEVVANGSIGAATVTVVLPDAVPLDEIVLGEDTIGPPAPHTMDGQTWHWETVGLSDAFIVRMEFPAVTDAEPPSWQAKDDCERAIEQRRLLDAIFSCADYLF